MEDDAKPLPHFIQALNTALAIQGQWDLFRLHGIYNKKHLSMGQLHSFEIIENLKDPSSAAAFLIKPSAAQKLLAYSESFYMPVDDYMECRYLHQLRILAIKPDPINIAEELPTTIADRRKPQLSISKRLLKELYQANHGLRNFIWRLQRCLFHEKINH